MKGVRCHAVRRLSPFLGVTQVIELPAARALTTDGLNWELQMRVERAAGWGSLNGGRSVAGFCRYGAWSAEEGLACFPPPPQLDRAGASRCAAELIDLIAAAQLPFALSDTLECWLLDAVSGKPCALLHSQSGHAPLPERPSRRWCASVGEVVGIAQTRLSAMERQVSQAVMPGPVWIERQADGSGRSISGSSATFSPADFPELLLAIEDESFIAWRAPRLLMLPLSAERRSVLEALASAQPGEVDRFWRLYPCADAGWLNTMRVQARLMASA